MSKSAPSNQGDGLAKLQNLLNHPGIRMDDDMKLWVDPSYLVRNSDQPRKTFRQDALDRHAKSIDTAGQIEPIVIVSQIIESGGKVIGLIVDGERTWRACKQLGIWVYVVFTDKPRDVNELFERALVANFDHERHTINETVDAVARLHDGHKLTFEQIRERLGLGSQADVINYYKLRRLHADLRPLLDLTPAEARASSSPRMLKVVALKLSEFPETRQKPLWFSVMHLRSGEALRKLESHGSGPSQKRSPADTQDKLNRLILRSRFDLLDLCTAMPVDHLNLIVTRASADGTLANKLKLLEDTYIAAAYLYMMLATTEVEMRDGPAAAGKIRTKIRERLNLGNWNPPKQVEKKP